MKQVFFLVMGMAVAILSSCGLISINDSGYRMLSEKAKARVLRCNRPIDSLTFDGNIYQVDVAQMREFLACHDKVVIYEYAAYCSSKFCVDPQTAEDMCESHGYDLCLIISSYMYLNRISRLDMPVLAIWQEPYHTDKEPKYCRMFFDELTGIKQKERGWGRFYVFNHGKFLGQYSALADVFTSAVVP